MFFFAIFIFLSGLPPACAAGWDDFSNNLATDLAPFLSLFGEQLTKQYLSESITFLDYFIFAMAPMGILTALVSAIRVCGSSRLRALIGRAQEGGGAAEAELCSSTSHTVCELYNNGGITRVFGRPKILEIVYDPVHSDDTNAGIYTFQSYFNTHHEDKEWEEIEPIKPEDSESDTHSTNMAGSAPNLSLNVGIKRQRDYIFWTVAIVGLVLQAGVLIFAFVVTYFLRWEKDDGRVDSYACPLAIIGTVLVCSGVYLCAFLIGQSTEERTFRRKPRTQAHANNPAALSTIYWVQPGNQSIGDQIFESFSYSDHKEPLQKYISSSKKQRPPGKRNTSEPAVWVAVSTTILGFVLQFVGLRGLHSAISVAQLGAIMAMSAVRATLRMKRLQPDDNFLADHGDMVVGHELDWLALHIGQEHTQDELLSKRPFWHFSGVSDVRKRILCQTPSSSDSSKNIPRVLAYRTRLAELTQSPSTRITGPSNFKIEMVEVRQTAQKLSEAIENTINVVFKSASIKEEWRDAERIWWGSNCHSFVKDSSTSHDNQTVALEDPQQIFLELHREKINANNKTPWRFKNKLELEGLLGLWVWSLKFDQLDRYGLLSHPTGSKAAKRIVGTSQDKADLGMWLRSEAVGSLKECTLAVGSKNFSHPGSLWRETSQCEYSPLPEIDDHTNNHFRVFGWHTTEYKSHGQTSGILKVLCADTETSLISSCGQEIFGSFITSILSIALNIGNFDVKEEGDNVWLNSNLASEIINLFVAQDLGSSEDAVFCVVPPMMTACQESKSFVVTMVEAAKDSGTKHRKDGEWKRAESVLKWALEVCIRPSATQWDDSNLAEGQPVQAAVALCELYRWALRERGWKQFGINGIAALSNQEGFHEDVQKVIARYKIIVNDSEPHDDVDTRLMEMSKYKDLSATLRCLTWSEPVSKESKGYALCQSAAHGWTEVILVLLELGVDINFMDANGRTALSYAAECGNTESLRVLMKYDASPNVRDMEGRTPLLYAAKKGFEPIMRILIGTPSVNLSMQDRKGNSPLGFAAQRGLKTILQLLLDAGVDINAANGEWGTELQKASYEGDESAVKLLLEAGADVNAQGEYGSALAAASYKGDQSVIKILLEAGAEVNTQGEYRSALAAASCKGDESVIKMLLEAGADVNAQAGFHGSALAAASEGGHKAVVKLLLDLGADINMETKEHGSTLTVASRGGDVSLVKLLLEAGADVNASREWQHHDTPLTAASGWDHEPVVKLLLEAGADVNARGGFYDYALMAASDRGNEAIVKLLLEAGAEINVVGSCGTALERASTKRHESVVKLLLEAGAKPLS